MWELAASVYAVVQEEAVIVIVIVIVMVVEECTIPLRWPEWGCVGETSCAGAGALSFEHGCSDARQLSR